MEFLQILHTTEVEFFWHFNQKEDADMLFHVS